MDAYMSPAERHRQGKILRKITPRSSHGGWVAAADRADAVDLITSQDRDRLQSLLPIRYGRMAASPLAFYLAGAKIMSADLANSPVTGLNVQLCGEAHLMNFGGFAESGDDPRFDISDFDETLPGPWEWDVKRLATSFAVAGHHNEFGDAEVRLATHSVVAAYRRAMAEFSGMATLDIRESYLPNERIIEALSTKDDDPTVLIALRDVPETGDTDALRDEVETSFSVYRETLRDDRSRLLRQFRPIGIAIKIAGVASVGTRLFVMLLQGRDENDTLLLEIREATGSVLEDHLPKSTYLNPGRRVVEGQRLMQASDDVFLGWAPTNSDRQYYWRRTRDVTAFPDVAAMGPHRMRSYADICGWTLARAHARTGDRIAISGYLGSSDVFDHAVTEFAAAYADQNERDHAAFVRAIESGRIDGPDDRPHS
jgi:uncharacterized protein (DUF2252 family)